MTTPRLPCWQYYVETLEEREREMTNVVQVFQLQLFYLPSQGNAIYVNEEDFKMILLLL